MDAPDRLLVGVDLPHSHRKLCQLIHDAYNDARGVTAAFTLNALRHVNAVAVRSPTASDRHPLACHPPP
jgi:uncharacterized SAM-dependent methyltransferase